MDATKRKNNHSIHDSNAEKRANIYKDNIEPNFDRV